MGRDHIRGTLPGSSGSQEREEYGDEGHLPEGQVRSSGGGANRHPRTPKENRCSDHGSEVLDYEWS